MKNLKIAHIDTQLTWRGGERQALELIKGLNARNQINVLFCKPDCDLSSRAEEAGISVIHLPLRGEWDVLSALKIRSFIKQNEIDIVHAHTSHAHMIGLMAVKGIRSCRFVVSRRVDFHLNNFLSRKIKYGPGVDRIITVSDAIKRILLEDGIDSKRVVTVRSGFVTGEFSSSSGSDDIRERYGIPEDAVVIVTVAALAPHKALHDLIKAAHRVLKKHSNVYFLIAGEGELKDSLEKNISSLKLEKSVILLGFIKDIASVYKAAAIFAMSSREEGLCTSILDAMYFGLPIVATSAGGIPELVQDGVNGLIVPVGDHVQFADKLSLLIESQDRRVKMGARSREILEQNKIEQTIEKTLLVYRSLFSGNSNGAGV